MKIRFILKSQSGLAFVNKKSVDCFWRFGDVGFVVEDNELREGAYEDGEALLAKDAS